MANKFTDFLKELLGTSAGSSGKQDSIDPKILRELYDYYEELTNAMDEHAKAIDEYKKKLAQVNAELSTKAPDSKEYEKINRQLKEIQKGLTTAKDALGQAQNEAINFIETSSKKHNLNPKNLQNGLKNFDKINNAFDKTGGNLSNSGKVARSVFDGISKGVGKLGFDLTGKLGTAMKFLENPMTALATAATMAGEQIIDLNDKLIKFQREMNGSLQARTLGMDIYGNNQSLGNTDSLATMASTNGLDEKDILDSYKAAFKTVGQLGAVNVKGKEKELQAYGVSIARMNKLYGLSGETTGKVAGILMNQYGKGINETAVILQKGAVAAKQAGVNVGIFFDNMAKIADLQGTLFVKGGSEGIEQAAFALTKLGLSAEKLAKLNDSYQGFGDLVDKQQRQLSLGLQNLSAAQSRVFAKVQTGDSAGALRIQQFAAAQDIKNMGYTDRGGMITNQGIQSLKASGMDAEEIKSVQRLINQSNKLGVSLDALQDETKLTSDQLQRKRDMEQEELTVKEKLNAMWGNIKAVLIDPIATVLAPLFDFVIEGVTKSFSVLKTVLAPVIMLFQIVGKALTGFSNVFKKIWDSIERAAKGIMKLFGFNGDGAGMSKMMDKISKGLDTLIEVLTAPLNIIATVVGWIADGIDWLVDKLGNFFGSSSSDNPGSVTNSTTSIVNGGNAGSSTSVMSTVGNILFPQFAIFSGIYDLLGDWFGMVKKKDEKEATVKISSAYGSPTNADVARIMEARKLDNTYAEQSAKENMLNSNALKGQGQPIVINNKFSTEYGGMKTKIQGR